ncbi:hypothetical protein Q5752_000332 [Cryptotrichosporon argae]
MAGGSWAVTLPALDGLFKTPTFLLGPFSLFTLRSRLFRSSPNPSASLLDPILTYTPADSLPAALSSLSTFVTQLKAAKPTVEAAEPLIDPLLRAYLHAVGHCARCDGADASVRAAERQCLDGVFILRSLVGSTAVDLALLHTVTPASALPDPHDHLRPLLHRANELTAVLKHSLRSTPASKSVASPAPTVSEAEAVAVLDVLDTFVAGVAAMDEINGLKPAKTKRDREAAVCRPRRVALEARLVGCNLALSMATATIKQVKRRALAAAREAGGSTSARTSVSGEGGSDEGESDDGVEWEGAAEKRLQDCLAAAVELVDLRRSHVLVDEIITSLFTGELPATRTPSPQATEASSESDSSDDEEEEDEDADGPTHPCPLRTLFELHDRFEEQRLAVWMALPADTREKMGVFMRGTDGVVGAKWDELGLGLVQDFDSDSLLAYGLGPDKLDKWLDIAARRNAKKMRRRK